MKRALLLVILCAASATAQELFPRFSVGAGVQFADFATDIRADLHETDGTPIVGTDISLERDLGLDPKEQLNRFTLQWRPFNRHELSATYFSTSRHGLLVIERTIRFEDAARVLSGAILIGCALSASAQTEPPPAPATRWQQTRISLGFNTYHGNSDSLSFSARFDSIAGKGRLESALNLDSDFSRSGGRSFVDREKLDWALRRTFLAHPKGFAMFHTWFEHNQTSGIKFRGTAGPGLGAHFFDKDKARLTLEGGIAITVEEQTEDATYPTFFLDPTFLWNITKQTSMQSLVKLRLNLEESDDVRLHHETNLTVQITQRIGVQIGATIDYDNQPVRGHETTDVQTYTMLSFTIGQGRR